jgi:hypothetical protein
MVTVVISNKKNTHPGPEDASTPTANSIFLNILAANPWFQRFYEIALIPASSNSEKAKNLTQRYPNISRSHDMPCHPNVKTCTHIKVTGHPCGSPALSGERFCYFHQRMIYGVRTPPKSRIHPMALIENEEGIQVALMETINAIARNTIDLKRASLILRALAIATHNARRARFDRCESEMVRSIPDYPPAPAIKPESPAPILEAAALSVSPSQWQKAKEKQPREYAAAEPQVPRKPPAGVTTAPVAQAKAVNARPQRE